LHLSRSVQDLFLYRFSNFAVVRFFFCGKAAVIRDIARLGLAVFAVLVSSSFCYSQNISSPGQDPLAGSRVYGAKGCSQCHSINGIGGKIGPDLARVNENRSFNDIAAAMWNHLPQMAAEAKKRGLAMANLSAIEAGDLIAFLFTRNYFDGSGNADSGKRLFTAKNCVLCHQIGSIGGVWGPNLDAFGQTAAPINVAAAMWNHGPAMAEAMRARGIDRPNLRPVELRDLVAYLRSMAPRHGDSRVSVLPGQVSDGRMLFASKQCIKCHNVQGTGGKIGPDLGRRGLHRDLIEFSAALWNKAPAMLRAMKLRKVAVPAIKPEEMADIVAYLRSFQYLGEPGDAARGRRILAEKQCLSCHSLGGEGGSAAPDFARAKGLESPAAVIAALWTHGDVMVERARERNLAWPQLTSDDMAHVMAFFERVSRSAR
jgi:cytochrome c2